MLQATTVLAQAQRPEILQRIQVAGRTFVLRNVGGRFPFEVSEQTGDGHLTNQAQRRSDVGHLQGLRWMRFKDRQRCAMTPAMNRMLTLCALVGSVSESNGRFQDLVLERLEGRDAGAMTLDDFVALVARANADFNESERRYFAARRARAERELANADRDPADEHPELSGATA